VLYTSAFRRLAGVTQVSSALEGHVYHNRLTHTLKVAQVARRLAEMLESAGAEQAARLGAPLPGIDPDVAEAAALAHDLGHPPFGHIAELELQELSSQVPGLDSFEGNAQSFRIVTKVSSLDTSFMGLNLTRATLSGILKYPWMHEAGNDRASKKWGAYQTEIDDFRFACGTGEGDAPPTPSSSAKSLEAEIMDWADDITYAVHDAEDYYRAGLVPLERLVGGQPELPEFLNWVDARWRAQHPEEPITAAQLAKSAEVIELLLGTSKPYEGTGEQRTAIRAFTSSLIGRYVRATSLDFDQGAGRWELRVASHARLEVSLLKELTWRYVIERPALAAQQHGQRAIIRYVYNVFMDAAARPKSMSILPLRTAEQVRSAMATGSDTPALRARFVMDAICAMTEDEVLRLYARLTGHSMGSVRDSII
jgi:dGTPase